MEPPKIKPERLKIELIDSATSHMLDNFKELRQILDEVHGKLRNKAIEMRTEGYALSFMDKSGVPDYYKSLANEFSKKSIEFSEELRDITSRIRELYRKLRDEINILEYQRESAIKKFIESI